jgi:hypothetical protein
MSDRRSSTVATHVPRLVFITAAAVLMLAGCTGQPDGADHTIMLRILLEPPSGAETGGCSSSAAESFVEKWGGENFSIGNGENEELASGTLATDVEAETTGDTVTCALSGTVAVPDSSVYTAAVAGVGARQDRASVEAAGWAITMTVTEEGEVAGSGK